jgi:DHA1 family multidrug resistance protein-like MFS transporter
MAFVRSAEELVILRMIQGAVTGVMGASNALVAATVPRGKTGYAMGLMQVAIGLGLGLGPIIGGLVADIYGYQSVFYITAALLAVAGVVVWIGVNEKFVPNQSVEKKRFNFVNAWHRVLYSPGVRLLFLLRFINQVVRIIYIPILPMFIISMIGNHKQINSYTGIVIGVASAATAISSVCAGRVGDRVGHRPIVIICLLASGIVFFLQSLSQYGWQLIGLQMLYGAALGGIITGISALLANYTQKGDEGAVYGLDSSINAGARMIGPLLGVGISTFFGIRMVFGTASLLYLIAFILSALNLQKQRHK